MTTGFLGNKFRGPSTLVLNDFKQLYSLLYNIDRFEHPTRKNDQQTLRGRFLWRRSIGLRNIHDSRAQPMKFANNAQLYSGCSNRTKAARFSGGYSCSNGCTWIRSRRYRRKAFTLVSRVFWCYKRSYTSLVNVLVLIECYCPQNHFFDIHETLSQDA